MLLGANSTHYPPASPSWPLAFAPGQCNAQPIILTTSTSSLIILTKQAGNGSFQRYMATL
jgi:hypothetical protein